MAKTEATRRSKRQSKVVTSEVVEEEDNVKTEGQTETVSPSEPIVGTSEDAPKEDQDEQDSQMDPVIEVKGSTTTVTVSWDDKNKEGEVDDAEKRTDASDQMMDSEEPTQIISSADAVGSTEDAPSESAETKKELEMQESGESPMETVAGSTATVTETLEKNDEEGESDDVKKETNGGEQKIVEKKPVKGKRKAPSTVATPPTKKTKLINDGFCLYVGNLNNSKTFDEVKDSLANYFMAQSLLVQNIRLDRSKKHAYVDVASEMDLTKGLTLNGEMMHDKPLKIAKAKVKSEVKVKVKDPVEDKKAKDERCLFLKNVPYEATKEDIQKIFPEAVGVRFPGGTESPKKGIAFVEFKKKAFAKKELQRKQGVEIQGRILIVDFVGETNKANDTKASSKNTLFVSNLPFAMKEKTLMKHFQKAVSISVPKHQGQSRGFAFVEFASAADAEKALQASKNKIIFKRAVKVQFCKMGAKSVVTKVSKTLIVMGLAEKTTAETLKSAFEGAVRARVTVDRETGDPKGFGFVDFESEDKCKAVKEAMEDCEIDGSKVTVAFAKPEGIKDPESLAKPPVAPGGPPAAQGAGKGGPKGKSGKRKRRGKGRGAGTPQDAVKEVENKG